jgi:putative ABC transport system permease protein
MRPADKFRRLFHLDRGVRDVDAAVNDEFSFHFDMTMRELLASGLSKEDAERETARRFGDIEAARVRVTALDRDRVEQTRRGEWWSAIGQDLRYALRGMKANPAFTLGIVATLGLGVGANATMFGVVDRLLLRAPAFLADDDRVGRVYLARNNQDGTADTIHNLQYKRYLDLREFTTAFDAMAPYMETNVIIGDGQEARELPIVMAGAEFWPMFTARPVAGRFFLADEDRPPNGEAVVVLGYGFWQSRYGGQPSAIGQELRIDAKRYRIIGVAPREFTGLSLRAAAAFVPFVAAARGMAPTFDANYNISWLEIVARRKPGVSVETASRELGLAYERSILRQRAGIANATPMSVVKPRAIFGSVLMDRGPHARSDARVALWLFCVTGIVLLIAAANVAGLLLARAIRRRREIAVRVALGVSRARLLTMLTVEAMALALLGAAAGLIVAEWGGKALRVALMPDIEWTTLRDPRTIGIATGVAVLCGLLAGLAPMVQAGRTDLAEAMRGGNRDGVARSRLRTGLLLFQAALSVVLLVGAGLFVNSLRNAKLVPLGYDPEHVTYISIDDRGYDYAPGDTGVVQRGRVRNALMSQRNRLLERARSIPGVERATITYAVPFWQSVEPSLFVPGIDSVNRLGEFMMHGVSGDYFATMGTRVLRGRPIADTDGIGAPPVIVVSDAMAEKLWPRQDPLGKCVKVNADSVPCSTVVGVAEGIVRGGEWGRDTKLQYYLHIDQYSRGSGGLFVRTRRPAAEMAEAIRGELQSMVSVPQYVKARSLSSIIAPNMRQWQLGATMFTLFGVLALVLSAIGLYSIISYSVAQRMHEMGIRVALGARSGDVVGMVMSEGMRLTLVGLVIGATLSYYAAPYLQKLLFRVEPREPTIFAVVGGVLLAVAAMATMVPALRASRVDPQEALRAE